MKLARWAPVSGVLYVIPWLLALFVFGDAGESDSEIVSWYADSGNRDKQLAAFLLLLLSTLLFVWFLSVLRGRIAAAEGTAGPLTALAFGGGLVATALWTTATGLWTATSFAVDDADEFVVDPNTTRLLDNLGYMLWFSGTTFALFVALSVGLVGLKGHIVPRWLAWLSLLVAASMLVSFFFIPFLAWLGWVLVVSLVLLFWKPSATAPDMAAPAG